MTHSNRQTFIEHEAAYEDAIARRIRANASVGRQRRWFAQDASREGLLEDLRTFVASDRNPGEFMLRMAEAAQEWGSLTEKQEAGVRKVLARIEERRAGFAAKRAEECATAKHVGVVGERRAFTLTVTFETGFETQFGFMTVLGLKDADGNVFIYKGSAPFAQKGETVDLVATVKEHGEREGLKQTIIARPGKVVFHPAAA